jgi:GAF domain-containing protein
MRPEKEHFIAVPLKGRNSIFGILVVARNRDPEFIEEEALIVKSFADAATVALENAQLHHELSGAREPVRHVPRPATLAGRRAAGKGKGVTLTGRRTFSRSAPPAQRGV